MKKSKAISLLLCLSLLASLLIPGTLAMPAKAAEGDTDNGMKVSKTAVANNNGGYTITLEAYATGKKVISEVKKDVPTDIILVLDQSGSMAQNMYTYDFREYSNLSNDDFYDVRYNQQQESNRNLYYKKQADGSYATVSVTVTTGEPTYSPYKSGTNYNYYRNSNNLYAKVGTTDYKKVTVSTETEGEWWEQKTYYIYKIGDTVIARSDGWDTSPDFDGIDGNVLYYATTDESQNVYTYTYTDKDGNTQIIGTSTGINTKPTGFTLYQRYRNGSTTKLQALKNAVTTFANNVAEKAKGVDGVSGTADDVDHRIAVVGFASSGNDYNSTKYENTEVFIGSNTYTYGASARAQYKNALQHMNTETGKKNVIASTNNLDAYGGTFTNLGLEMANGIFGASPIDGGNRKRVIVVFTDGQPGTGNSVNSSVANSAVSQAYKAKSSSNNNGYDATVYTVGIFSGADGTPVSSFDNVENTNKFMHLMSSNYQNAQSYSDSTKYGTATYPTDGSSYYLSASDAGTLNNIFKQISDQIESGGSSTTLDESAVVKDIIAPAFALPTGTSATGIKLETYRYTGENKWTKNSDAMGARATVSGDQVSVTGFDFAKNYVGTVTENGNVSYRGNKLVISFTVTPKADFLGGNNVYTNTSAGVYEDAKAENAVVTFPRPQVNVPIKNVTVTAADKNVYLLGDLTADQIKTGATVKCGEVSLDLSKATDTDKPYGLDPWQTEYVDITVTVKDKDGNSISDKLENLTEDTTYTVEVTVSPKTKGTSTPEKGDAATAKTGINDPAANIYVFKPELTFKDSTAYYGESVPTNNDYSSNKVGSETWKHGDTASTDEGVTMLGTKPTLDISYTPDESKLEAGKYTKQDVPVAATVKIGTENVNEHTTFVHQDCTPACGWEPPATPGAPAFLIHIQTCTLTITKTDGAADESYVFDVYKDGSKYSEVTIEGNTNQTIYELPVGTYTIEEDTGWSWRYPSPTYSGNSATLDKDQTSNTITCTNTKAKNYWLNGYSGVVTNIFGVKH